MKKPTIRSSYSHPLVTLASQNVHLCNWASPGLKASFLLHRKSKAHVQVVPNSNLCFEGLSAWDEAIKYYFLLHNAILGSAKMVLGQWSQTCNWCFWGVNPLHSLLRWLTLWQSTPLLHVGMNKRKTESKEKERRGAEDFFIK